MLLLAALSAPGDFQYAGPALEPPSGAAGFDASRLDAARPEAARLAAATPSGGVSPGGAAVEPAQSAIRGKDGAPMVLVPAGEFLMGSTDLDKSAQPNEKPQHRVHLDAYYIDQYEVTVARYREFLNAVRDQGHRSCAAIEPQGHDHAPEWWDDARWTAPEQPVVGVDWYDAYAYCAWAEKRLPAEAEWEKAARGVDGRIYPWGNEYDGKRANGAKVVGKTSPVGSYPEGASPCGALDMAGNIWEWVQDFYAEDYYGASPSRNPPGAPSGQYRVIRGGSWNYEPRFLRSAARNRDVPAGWGHGIGFRCARNQEPLESRRGLISLTDHSRP